MALIPQPTAVTPDTLHALVNGPLHIPLETPGVCDQIVNLLRQTTTFDNPQQLFLSQSVLYQTVTRVQNPLSETESVKQSALLAIQSLSIPNQQIHTAAVEALKSLLNLFPSVLSAVVAHLGVGDYYQQLLKNPTIQLWTLTELRTLVDSFMKIPESSSLYTTLNHLQEITPDPQIKMLISSILATSASIPLDFHPVPSAQQSEPKLRPHFVGNAKSSSLIILGGTKYSPSKADKQFVVVEPACVAPYTKVVLKWVKNPRSQANDRIGIIEKRIARDAIEKGAKIGTSGTGSCGILIQNDQVHVAIRGVLSAVPSIAVTSPLKITLHVVLRSSGRYLLCSLDDELIPIVLSGIGASVNVAISSQCPTAMYTLISFEQFQEVPAFPKVGYPKFTMTGPIPGTVKPKTDKARSAMYDDEDDDDGTAPAFYPDDVTVVM